MTQARKESKRLTVIYIMGYGRSGSTITDILLNQHPDIVSVGALNNLHRWLAEGMECACGSPIADCEFWSDVLGKHLKKIPGKENTSDLRQVATLESLSSFPSIILGLTGSSKLKRYGKKTGEIFKAIGDISGASFIVDSSKSTRDCTGRPLLLSKTSGIDIKIIHLVRDGRAVGWSAMKKSGSDERRRSTEIKAVNFTRTVLSWAATNLLSILTARLLPRGSVMRLRYEDLCSSTDEELRRIGEFAGLDPGPIIESIGNRKELAIGHNLGGNRVRFSSGLTFKPDFEWTERLPWIYKQIFWILAWPVAIGLGYEYGGER